MSSAEDVYLKFFFAHEIHRMAYREACLKGSAWCYPLPELCKLGNTMISEILREHIPAGCLGTKDSLTLLRQFIK